MAVALIALVLAAAGTAGAAGALITSSSQVRTGAIDGSDIKNRSITGIDIANGSIGSIKLRGTSRLGGSDISSQARGIATTATEAFRKAGPEDQKPGQARVATLKGLPAGVYLITAKTILTATTGDLGVLSELLRADKTGGGHCVLDAQGDTDHARAPIATPYSSVPNTFYMQITRSVASPFDVALTCDSNVPWRASDTSIVATRLTGAPRSAVGG